ncbi:MAG: DNA helicase, partial [Muribaculaceae bacterium]|nr:DNA helicase [Muribaculaceae bacterium]
PMPVDSSQMAAVLEGGKGNSFILYGPPGTGKSQTITNLIANALYHNKRVLFVAEKMAALSVVQSRLEKIGLDPFCLELHSNKSTKRHVLRQLEKALKVIHIVSPSEYASQAEKIFAQRKELIAYMNALHTPSAEDGLSLYDCIIRYESIGEEPLKAFRYDKSIDELILKEGIKGIEELLGSRFQTVLKLVGQPSKHPLNGMHIDRSMLPESDVIARRMVKDSDIIAGIRKDLDNLRGAKELREKLLLDNAPELLDEDPESLRRQWREVKAKWFLPRIFARRKFVNSLRQYNNLLTLAEIEPLIENLMNYRNKHDQIAVLQQIVNHYFDIEFNEDEVPEATLLAESEGKLRQWSANSSKMRDWLHWSECSDELRKNGIGCVADALEESEYEAASLKDSFLKALLKRKAEEKISKSEVLAAFEGMLFDEKTAAYKQMTEDFQLLTCKELYARLASRVPRMTDNPSSGSEIGLLNRNISNGGRGVSLRDLFDQLPTLLPRLCPCMLMSPMSAAQYIDLTGDKFDLVVFDEASQMPTSEAVGAIARGKALIVVGDPKQMPPTSFFTSTNVDAEEASIDDMESILEDCRTLEIPSLQLSWHYRSRHESLIAFSNNEYYDGSLITFPSVDDQRTKLHFIPVSGYYDKGGKRCNKSEAEAIVNEVVRRLESEQLRRHSIGVIAFSVMQQGLIEDILQDRLDHDKALHEAAMQMYEPIFVKNLENVQGDERDVILFSVGYGPDKNGKVSMNFGPLNNAGGERRLNVAVSRARQEMYIFSTLKSGDIDLRRSKAKGVEGLKHFLQYAETRTLPSNYRGSAEGNNSAIADQIAAELRKKGYVVATSVGRSKFRVDVEVESPVAPGTYLLGILLDGEGYRDTHTTRDREVVQPSMLQALDWKVMRVWSVDWFNNKERVIERITEQLTEHPGIGDEPQQKPVFDISQEEIEERKTNAIDYTLFSLDSEEALLMEDTELMRNVISVEQPVTLTLLCRRVNALRGYGRVTSAMQKTFKDYACRFFTDPTGAIWLSEDDCNRYSHYRPNSGRDVTDIPQIEIINSIRETLVEQIALDEDSLTQIASKKMGFTRRGANVDAAFTKAVEVMKNRGELESVGDNLRLKSTD